jgi:hypothetical protein
MDIGNPNNQYPVPNIQYLIPSIQYLIPGTHIFLQPESARIFAWLLQQRRRFQQLFDFLDERGAV